MGIDDCFMILLPAEDETPNELRITKADILLLSKSHIKKVLIEKINKFISTRTKYVDMLFKVNQQLGIEL